MTTPEIDKQPLGDIEDNRLNINNIQSEICDWILIILSILALPTLTVSLYRMYVTDWRATIVIQIMLAVILWLLTFFRHQVAYNYRVYFLLIAVYTLAIVGYAPLGFIGSGKTWMLLMVILAAVLFGKKAAITTILIGTLSTAIIAAGFIEGAVTLQLNEAADHQGRYFWISPTVSFVFFSTAISGAILYMSTVQSNLITRLYDQNTVLKSSQNSLERRFEQQTHKLSAEIMRQKMQAAELTESEARFRAFTEASSDRMWELDTNYCFTSMSPSVDDLTKPVDQLLGKPPWEVAGVSGQPEAWEEFRKNFDSRAPIRNIKFTLLQPNGDKAYGAYFGVPQFSADGEFTGYLGITQNQTKDVLLRRKAETIEKRFYESFAKLDAGFSFWDPNDRLVMCNDFYRKTQSDIAHLLEPGILFEEIIRKRAFSDWSSAVQGQEEEWIAECLEYFRTGTTARQFSLGDRWIETHPYHNEDGSTIIFQIDVTEQNQVEAMKSDFVSLVSHELRTPLTSIYGSLKLLQEATSDLDANTSNELISVAGRNSERLLSLVNDILDLQKIVAGKLELNIESISLSKIIVESLEENAAFAEAHDTSYEFLNCDVDLTINGDTLRIKQILTNLLSNAAKFSPPGRPVQVSLDKKAAYAAISISDEGPGISSIDQDRIFAPFVQIANVNTRETGGTGLGLPICKALVAEHKGTISLSSESGQGAIFCIQFPLA